uniref:Uncharacterized protein n=1 Tax=Anopheles quadriannulatus TaxID=34691 RepID=A0A182XSI6_ANOQN
MYVCLVLVKKLDSLGPVDAPVAWFYCSYDGDGYVNPWPALWPYETL